MTDEEAHEINLQRVLSDWRKVLSKLPHTKTLEERIEKLENAAKPYPDAIKEFDKKRLKILIDKLSSELLNTETHHDLIALKISLVKDILNTLKDTRENLISS